MSADDDAWWVINAAELYEALERAHAGDEPYVVYMELYANSEIERPVDGPQ